MRFIIKNLDLRKILFHDEIVNYFFIIMIIKEDKLTIILFL